jgi:oligopeptide/dipeptide ABC transporter ATP-binding protein
MSPLLEVENLSVEYRDTRGAVRPALERVSLRLNSGEILGVLGESGSGKSTLAQSLLHLLPANGRFRSGKILFGGQDLAALGERELQKIRGARISLVFQEPSIALHPTMRVGDQIERVIAAHESLDRAARRDAVRNICAEVFASDADRISRAYPHQLSGGQRQRVLIAQAIACDPAILIADEPTASLDSSTQAEILELLRGLRDSLRLAIIFITHNPAILAALADRIIVMYAGRIVEEGPAGEIFRSPRHPYLRALLRSLPASPELALATARSRLPAIRGAAPDLALAMQGCAFEPRCEEKMPQCAEREPELVMAGESQSVACFKYGCW